MMRGEQRTITQAEGGEQGDPLMPLFSVGIQGVTEDVATPLVEGEQLCAFLDDVYLLCGPARVEPLHKVLVETMLRESGCIRARPELGIRLSWYLTTSPRSGKKRGNQTALLCWGLPSEARNTLHRKWKRGSRGKERMLSEAISKVPDLQYAWQILLQSANPRTNHSMRTLPPTLSAEYCQAHDEGIWGTAKALLGRIPDDEDEEAHRLATLPMRLGCLGLRSAARCAPGNEPQSWPLQWSPFWSMRMLRTAVWRSSGEQSRSWIVRDSGGDTAGQTFAKASDHLRTSHAILARRAHLRSFWP